MSKLGSQGLNWMKPVESTGAQEQKSIGTEEPQSTVELEQVGTQKRKPAQSKRVPEPKSPTVSEPKSIGAKAPKSKNPDWAKCSYYLEAEVMLRLQIHAARTRQDQSDIVNKAVKEFLDSAGA